MNAIPLTFTLKYSLLKIVYFHLERWFCKIWNSQCLTKKLFLKNFAGQAPQLKWGLKALVMVDRCRFFKCVNKNAFSANAISHKLHLYRFPGKWNPVEEEFDDEEMDRKSSFSSIGGSGWGIPEKNTNFSDEFWRENSINISNFQGNYKKTFNLNIKKIWNIWILAPKIVITNLYFDADFLRENSKI